MKQELEFSEIPLDQALQAWEERWWQIDHEFQRAISAAEYGRRIALSELGDKPRQPDYPLLEALAAGRLLMSFDASERAQLQCEAADILAQQTVKSYRIVNAEGDVTYDTPNPIDIRSIED